MSSFKPGLKVGLLGGGQLARMLALKGAEMGLEVHVLSEKEDDPAAQVVRHWHQGSPHKAEDLRKFLKQVEFATFESEFYSGDLLAQMQEETGTKILPDPHVMRTLQDRLSQKESLLDKHIPTAPFLALHNKNDLHDAQKFFKKGFVLKKRLGGYDGNGTFIVRDPKDLSSVFDKTSLSSNDFIAEDFVPFKKEMAVIMARNADGEIVHFPLVETKQTQNRCDWVSGPQKHARFEQLVLDLAVYIDGLHYVGVIAFELFDTGRELLVNEIAPRVHNSGHYSMEALEVDQFTLHWMALLDFPFFEIKAKTPAFAMANLIGTSEEEPSLKGQLTGHLHWYGKKDNRAGRKMGHVNYVGKTVKSVLKTALKERELFKNLGSGATSSSKKSSVKKGSK